MRGVLFVALLMLLVGSRALAAAPEEMLRRNPYDYAARRELVSFYRTAGDYASA